MLTNYLNATRRFLQNPSAPTSLYSDADLTAHINAARGQLAGEAECIRYLGTISTVANQESYNFSAIDTGVAATTGIQGVINVRALWYGVGTGKRWVPSRPWEWFSLYNLNNAVPVPNVPTTWSQYGQGAAPGSTGSGFGGSFYISPPPDQAYTLYVDCVCYPNALVNDLTVEAIPYLWTDAVPFFATYYALLASQTGARMDEAGKYYDMYETFLKRARQSANSSVTRWQNSQAGDPAQAAKMQIRGGVGG